jgi:hypothetical protein
MTTHPDEKAGATQCDRLYHHLRDVGPITALDSWRLLGVMQPARRVHDLRKRMGPDGRLLDIRTRTVTVTNRWGEECHVAEYYLDQPKAAPTEQIGLLDVH